jgi:hypothetical protein
MTAEHQKALAQQALIPIHNEPPVPTFRNDWPKLFVTQHALFHSVLLKVAQSAAGN